MSSRPDSDLRSHALSGVPSNTELAERMARVEEKQDASAATLERIEGRLSESLDEQREKIEENDERVSHLWSRYSVGKWAFAAAGALGSAVGGLAAMGLF